MVELRALAPNKHGSVVTVASKRSSTSTASLARLKQAEADRASLLAEAAILEQRQALEIEEAQFQARLKVKKERLELEAKLAKVNAKIKVYQGCEERQSPARQGVTILCTDLCT